MNVFCRACQAVPSSGFCRLAGCPMPKPELEVVVYGDERDELLSLIRAKYPEATGLPECPPGEMTKGSVQDDSRLEAEIGRVTTYGDDILAACKAMKAAFGDPLTRRALGGHNEAQQEAILAASVAIAAHAKERK